MKIEEKSYGTIRLGDLSPGRIFRIPKEGDYYLKTSIAQSNSIRVIDVRHGNLLYKSRNLRVIVYPDATLVPGNPR